jgi:hypothetical protein
VAHPRIEASLDGVSWEVVPAEASLAEATLSLMRDPRAGRAVVKFSRRVARFIRLDPRLPSADAVLTLER